MEAGGLHESTRTIPSSIKPKERLNKLKHCISLIKKLHEEKTRGFHDYVRISALNLEDNQIGFGTLCIFHKRSFSPRQTVS